MDTAIRLLRELVAINSVNPTLVPGAPGERDVADLIAQQLRRAGLDVSVEQVADGRPNVVGVLEGRSKGRSLMFCGHTDTVGVAGMTDPFTPHERDGRMYGRGAQDMKGGVAAMMSAAIAIAERGGLAAGRLIVAAVVDEEHSSIGADALVRAWRADAAIVTEPTDLAIAVGHKGFAWVEVTVDGKAAHGSRPAEGQDAILRLGRVLNRLEGLDRELQARAPHPLVGTGSLHASLVTGGRELSSYPDRATLQMERRILRRNRSRRRSKKSAPSWPRSVARTRRFARRHRRCSADRHTKCRPITSCRVGSRQRSSEPVVGRVSPARASGPTRPSSAMRGFRRFCSGRGAQACIRPRNTSTWRTSSSAEMHCKSSFWSSRGFRTLGA
jgi:acetylornithine deacetylase/succinyl-diaminopimelate desuccinylase-like protein